jgi:CBS-domain-containing membrane protein
MPIDKAVTIMLTERIRKLPVMEKDGDHARLVGILSMTDIAKIQPKLFDSLKTLINEDVDGQEILTTFYVR